MLSYDDFHPYQKRAVIDAIRNKHGYLFMDTGMGKTVVSYAIHDQLAKRNLIQHSLVLAPKYVMNNVWRQEAKEWKFSKDFTFSRIHGSTYKGSAEYSRRMAALDDVDFHIINYEGLMWLSDFLLKEGGKCPWDIIFYDESTRMKRPSTKRFKAFKKFMSSFKYRYCLTGTPIPNGLEDIFGQTYVTDQGATVGRNITQFRKSYMKPLYTLHGRTTIYGEQDDARQRVAKKMAPRVIRLKKTEHLKLPPILYHDIKVTLPPDVMDTYRQLEKEYFIEADGHIIETFSKVATDMKLRQFLQGLVYEQHGSAVRIHTVKRDALKNLKLDGNSLVAYNFRFERDDIQTATCSTPFLDARTTDKQAEKWIIEWNNYSIPYFAVNPASAAFGLNLQAGGNNIVWYSLTWNAEHYSQLIDRLWRQGQRKTVNVYHIIFENTMDVVIANALQRKDGDQAALLQDIADYAKGVMI